MYTYVKRRENGPSHMEPRVAWFSLDFELYVCLHSGVSSME
jgi:hypothetical protein